MNSIQKLGDGVWLQTVQQISRLSKVMLPLAGAVFSYDPIVTEGKTARKEGSNYHVEEGCSLFVLCKFLSHNVDDESYYFSPSNNALYKGEYTLELPADAIAITEHEWTALCSGINDREIYVDDSGKPRLSAYPKAETVIQKDPTISQLLHEVKEYRNNYVRTLDNAVLRHRRQLELDMPTTLTPEEYKGLLTFIQSLFDFVSKLDLTLTARSVQDLAWPKLPSELRDKI